MSSIRGAQEMVDGFEVVFEPGVTSRHLDGKAIEHLDGKAIDMKITWTKNPFRLQMADGNFVDVPFNPSEV